MPASLGPGGFLSAFFSLRIACENLVTLKRLQSLVEGNKTEEGASEKIERVTLLLRIKESPGKDKMRDRRAGKQVRLDLENPLGKR